METPPPTDAPAVHPSHEFTTEPDDICDRCGNDGERLAKPCPYPLSLEGVADAKAGGMLREIAATVGTFGRISFDFSTDAGMRSVTAELVERSWDFPDKIVATECARNLFEAIEKVHKKIVKP